MLTFDEIGHIYKYKGTVIPSVTQVLGGWLRVKFGRTFYINSVDGTTVDAETFEDAQDFGTAIHCACKILLTGDLAWNVLDQALVASLREFEKWIEDYRIKPILVEHPLYSAVHRYAGTPDLICESGAFKGTLLIDFKTGIKSPFTGPQTAAYEMLYREFSGYRGQIRRFELTLPKDGGPYKMQPLTGINDNAFFLSKLFQYNFLKA